MTKAAKGEKTRPVGRPPNAKTLKSDQKNTLTNIFASTNLETSKSKRDPTSKGLKQDFSTLLMETEVSDTDEIQDVDMEERVERKTTEDITKNIDIAGTSNTVENTSHGGDSNKTTDDKTKSDATKTSKETTKTGKVTSTTNDSMETTEEDDPPTPTKNNSSKKKRKRQRGKRGKNKSVQRTLFEADSREFKITNINKTRFDLSFRSEPGPNAPEIGQNKIQELLVACQDHSDESMTIIPWKESDIGICPIIEEVEDVPKQLSQMKVYFPRFRPTAKGGVNYTSIFFGHDNSVADLLLDISFWLADSGFKLFKKSIQAENSAVIGWFLYGIKEINTLNLQEAISETEGNPKVGLRQMRIRTASTGKASNTKAMGIECDTRYEDHVKSCLIELYHSKRINWPLGIKLRYMRDPRFLCGAQALNKTKHLLSRHERFQDGIIVRRTRDIASLDIEDIQYGKSLRMIMRNMKSTTKPTMSVFHSIDPSFNQGDTYTVTFLPEFLSQADQILSQLVPYTIYLEGEYVEKFFSTEALAKSAGCVWDEEKGCATSALDNELDNITEMDDGYDFANPINPSNVLDLTHLTNDNQEKQPARTLFGNDNDSISTLGTKAVLGKKNDNLDNNSTTSTISNISLRSKASIITAVKKDLEEGLRGSIAAILREELAKMAPAPSNVGNPQTNLNSQVTPGGSVSETHATPGLKKRLAGPEKGAGQA